MSSKSKMSVRRIRKRTQGYRKRQQALRDVRPRDNFVVRFLKKLFF